MSTSKKVCKMVRPPVSLSRSLGRTGAHTCAQRLGPALRKASPLLRESGDPCRATPASTWRGRATLKTGRTACDNPTPRQCHEGHRKPF